MLTIRPATISDVPAILAIYNDAIENLTATFDLTPQTLEERRVWFQQFGERYPIFAAEWDGEFAGYACLTMYRVKPAYSRTAELSIYLDKRFHGRGIGTGLMGEVLREAEARGFHVILSAITGGNETSVRLHHKFGFELVGTFKEVGYKFGAWQDVWFYQKTLNA
ncbi:GNAT family N-acetyltransferase [Paenibacillus sp. HJGM_3]|uniref:GNAT family N-acetyltransferase n=1 Tax=Paenibacillus sp. HJGM_3 TaxID=3379816 RepID=UPI00385EAD10